MNSKQYCFFSNKKKKRRVFGNNKPHVDWLKIIWKCHEHFEWPSLANYFAHEQELNFGLEQLKELRKRQDSGQQGHKSKRKNVISYNTVPIDLDCDDPLYDGEPIR